MEEEERQQTKHSPITRLPEDVVNRIAAGEIIHRPANALKEMIENSLDANSKMIRIQLREGGLKMLQVQDDGDGVDFNDLPLLCQRFATSKLRSFEDLSKMQTFGFRGEALASISYVSASMNVVSKKKGNEIAYKASYANGSLVPPKPGQSSTPKPCAGSQGTFITAEDLFFNVPQRKRALKSASDEYAMALDVVSKYAIHYGGRGIGFSCKKSTSSMVDLSVPSSDSTTTLDAIGIVYGSKVSKELIPLEPFHNQAYGARVEGYISKPTWNARRSTFLLFINHRLVDSPALRRAVLALYTIILPKGSHPWIYLDVKIDEANVDVNVHPTKREVHFLHEEEIIEEICTQMQDILTKANTSKSFAMNQTFLGGFDQTTDVTGPNKAGGNTTQSASSSSLPQHMVRVDARAQTLDGMISMSRRKDDPADKEDEDIPAQSSSNQLRESQTDLESIEELRQSVQANRHAQSVEVVRSNTFVGIADTERALLLIQHSTKLFFIRYTTIIEEMAYQLLLRQFGAYSTICLEPAPYLDDLVKAALKAEPQSSNEQRLSNGITEEKVIEIVEKTLIEHSEMFSDYFNIVIQQQNKRSKLISLPNIFGGGGKNEICLRLTRIPSLILRLALQPNFSNEKSCLETILRELARSHVPLPNENETKLKGEWNQFWSPLMRFYTPSRNIVKQNAIMTITSLPSLYSVFERC